MSEHSHSWSEEEQPPARRLFVVLDRIKDEEEIKHEQENKKERKRREEEKRKQEEEAKLMAE